jgi:putative ABC transport system ATP-binding protein
VKIELKNVGKSFEDGNIVALRDISFTLEPGEFVALTGPSGGGKSTLLNLIGALDQADKGSITVGDQRLEHLDSPSEYRASTVGFVFQFHNLISTISALENVQVPMFGRGIPRSQREQISSELLDEVGLSHRKNASPLTLSGGERQRVALARALANNPLLLLADEPTGALDSTTGKQIIDLIQAVRRLRGTTILLVTNDDNVAELADRILRIRDGTI